VSRLRPSPIRSAAGGLIRFVQTLSSAAEEAGDHGIYDRSLAVAYDIAPSHQRNGAQRCMSVGSAVSIATARLQLQDIANKGGKPPIHSAASSTARSRPTSLLGRADDVIE